MDSRNPPGDDSDPSLPSAPRVDRRPCPLCRGTRPEPWLDKAGLRLVRCRACTMVYADPLPPGIDDAFYDRLAQPYYLSAAKLAGDFAEVRFDRERRLLRQFCPKGEVLDVGCSTGAFLHGLARRYPGAYRGIGIEVSRGALEYARQHGVPVIDGSLLDHDFAGDTFDAVTFWAVLEHLAEPAAFVRRAAGLMRPAGHCLVLVPNLRSLAVRFLGPRYRYILPQHINYFDLSTLRRLLTEAGLDVVASGGCHFNPLVIWQDRRRRPDEPVPDEDRAALLGRTTRLKQSPWLRPVRAGLYIIEKGLAALGLADNIWAVGRKP